MQNSETKFLRVFEDGRNLNLLQLTDAKLRTDDGCTFNVHRVTLARSSDYFRAMFCGMDTERSEFSIPGISGECLSDILCYVYTGEIEVTENNTCDLIIAADYLLLKDLRMEIKRNIKAHLTEVNCFRILQAAHQTSDDDLFRQYFRYIQTRFEGIMRCQQNELADLPLEILILILRNPSLLVYDENTVWQAIVEWTQKDIQLRMSHIPQLLLTLAMEDIGEELATKILQHEVVSKNPLFRRRQDLELDQMIKRKKISDLDVLLSFFRSYWTCFMEPNSHRIPLTLHVLSVCAGNEHRHNLYVTYDENPDLWRKITEVDYEPDALITVGQNIYSLNSGQLRKFNLGTMTWESMRNFWHLYNRLVVATGRCIYVIGQTYNEPGQGTHGVEVYHTVNNRWFNGVSLRNICDCTAVAIGEKIFVVGGESDDDRKPVMQMFDPAAKQWSRLSAPPLYYYTFGLVAYHQKIYMVGSYPEDDVRPELSYIAVFDPAENAWEKLPDMPYAYSTPGAVVFNDQLIIFDRVFNRNARNSRWDDAEKRWSEETYNFKDLHLLQSSCTINDVDAISIITKQNRDPGTQMEKSLFI